MLIKALGNNILAFLKKHFLPYLVKQSPVEENGVTLVLDEGVDRQADRPYLYNRVFDAAGIGGIEHSTTQIPLTGVYDNYNYSPTGKLFNSDGCTLMFLVKHQSGQSAWYMKGASNSWLEEFRYFSGDDKIRVKANGIGVHTIDQVCDFDYSKYHLMSITINFVDGEIKVYKDTELLGSVTASTPNSSNAYIYMGYIMKSNASFFYGKLKSYSQYYSVKSQSQITDIVNGKDDINNLCFRYVLEEGSGSKVYPQYLSPLVSEDNKHFFVLDINTSDITSNRIIDNDAPLLPNSGDMVGWSNVSYGYFNKNANNVASADVSNLEIDDFVLCFYFRKDGSDGVTQGICGIQAQTRATLGQSGYFIQTNTSNSLNIVFRKIGGGTETIPIGTVLQSKKWNHVVIYKNGTDLNYSLNGVSGNATLTFSEIDWTSTSKLTSFGGYATNTFSFTEGQVSVTQFQLGEYSTANVNAALAQETLPSLIADIPFGDGSGTTLTNNEGTNLAITVDDIEDFWKKQYSPSNGVTDVIFNRPLTHTGRKDFPLTPYQEPAYKNAGTDYATLSSNIIINDSDVIEIETLVTNYPAQGDHYITGWSTNNNNFIGLSGASSMVIKNGGNIVIQSTGLDLSSVNQFILKYKFTRVSSSSTTNVEFYVYDLDGTELFSYTGGSMLGALSTLDLLYKGEASSKYFVGTVAWTKFTRNSTLEHWWEYLGNDSLVIWDRVGGNHATITTSDITANQGTQDVYSSRLKDGYTIDSNEYGLFPAPTSGVGVELPTYNKDDVTNGTLEVEIYNLSATKGVILGYRGTGGGYNILGFESGSSTAVQGGTGSLTDLIVNGVSLGSSATRDDLFQALLPMWNTIRFEGLDLTGWSASGDTFQIGFYSSSTRLHGYVRNFKLEVNGTGSAWDIEYTGIGQATPWDDISGNGNDSVGGGHPTTFNTIDDVIPSSITNPTQDVYGNTLTHPAGTYLHSDIKLTSPAFRTLDTALQSNEELARDTTDANGNSVKDRLLIPISYNHSDKGFPCLKFNGVNTDYVKLKNAPYQLANNRSHKWEIWISDYNSLGSNTRQTVIGWDGYKPVYFGFRGTSRLFYYGGSSGIDVETSLTFSTLGTFYVVWEYTASPTYNTLATINLTGKIYNASGVLLFEHSESNYQVSGFQFDMFSLTLDTGTPLYPLYANLIKAKLWIDGELEADWQYAGNNSFLVQDVVGDNHGSITTADITLNQGEQDVFNCFVDGYGLNSLIRESTLFSIGSTLGTGNDSTNDANGNPILEHTAVVSTTITYTNNDIEILRTVDGSYTNIFILTEIDGTRIDTSVIPIGTSVKMVIDADKGDTDRWYISDGGTGVGVGDTAYWWETSGEKTIEWIKIDDNTNGGIQIRARVPSDYVASTGTPFIIHSITLTINEKTLPQHPYNGLDVFDNNLTTPRTKERTKSLKYTDND